MKIADVHVGGRYVAKVSGILTTVRVLAVRETASPWFLASSRRSCTHIDVVNERTGRRTTFRSAGRLRRAIAADTGKGA